MTALRTGITTGACAAAAAQAAAEVLAARATPQHVVLTLPGGRTIDVPVLYARLAEGGRAVAAVRKDAGDDPDVTHGLEVVVTVWPAPGSETVFLAGEGVGTVTKPGLQIPPGGPAINPGPRRMIAAAIAAVTSRPLCVQVAIPGGREIADKTFNPRLGVVGGLSVLGTTGIVRPYCRRALRDSLKCALDVAAACGVHAVVLAPGNIGCQAAGSLFTLAPEQIIEVGNEWGHVIGLLAGYPFAAVMAAGHPGKLAKLAAGDWDTHSSRSASATDFVGALHQEVLGAAAADTATVEGIFAALAPAARRKLGDALAGRVRRAIEPRVARSMTAAVVLVDMQRQWLGSDGDLSPWR